MLYNPHLLRSWIRCRAQISLKQAWQRERLKICVSRIHDYLDQEKAHQPASMLSGTRVVFLEPQYQRFWFLRPNLQRTSWSKQAYRTYFLVLDLLPSL